MHIARSGDRHIEQLLGVHPDVAAAGDANLDRLPDKVACEHVARSGNVVALLVGPAGRCEVAVAADGHAEHVHVHVVDFHIAAAGDRDGQQRAAQNVGVDIARTPQRKGTDRLEFNDDLRLARTLESGGWLNADIKGGSSGGDHARFDQLQQVVIEIHGDLLAVRRLQHDIDRPVDLHGGKRFEGADVVSPAAGTVGPAAGGADDHRCGDGHRGELGKAGATP